VIGGVDSTHRNHNGPGRQRKSTSGAALSGPDDVVPTISVDGPGVNALAPQGFEESPLSLAVGEVDCIVTAGAISSRTVWPFGDAHPAIRLTQFPDFARTRQVPNSVVFC
jgi:hypothetical protein